MSTTISYSVESPILQEGIARIVRRDEARQIVATWRLLSTGECVLECNIDEQPPPPHAVIEEASRLSVTPMPCLVSVVRPRASL